MRGVVKVAELFWGLIDATNTNISLAMLMIEC